ncbi:MAG: phosphate transport regulator [Ardenticatenaceae bacterium]|nr:MAG: phosphate transport regulator [Ardenticatenaceae bacterium]
MEWLKRFIKPKQNNFLQLLIQQGEFTVVSVEALQAYLKKPNEKRTERARQVEKDADEVYRILVHELEDSFVTPLDREDIFALGRALDNFIDYVYDTIEEMEIFDLEPFTAVSEMAALLLEMARELHLTMERLLDHPRVANEHARRVKKLENQVEHAYRQSLADLFQGPEDSEHIMHMLKCREILRHLSNAADQGDKAADIVMDIGVKWS